MPGNLPNAESEALLRLFDWTHEQQAENEDRARRTVARHADNADDLREMLMALGLIPSNVQALSKAQRARVARKAREAEAQEGAA